MALVAWCSAIGELSGVSSIIAGVVFSNGMASQAPLTSIALALRCFLALYRRCLDVCTSTISKGCFGVVFLVW